MAYPGQPQDLYEMLQILIEDQEARRSFEDHLRESQWGVGSIRSNRMYSGPWRTSSAGDITCVDLAWSPYLLGSLRIAMLKEVIGIAPQRYCVYVHSDDQFYRRLQLLMTCLPEEKIFLYPEGARLGGPFLLEPWQTRGQRVLGRPSLSGEEFYDTFVAPFQ